MERKRCEACKKLHLEYDLIKIDVRTTGSYTKEVKTFQICQTCSEKFDYFITNFFK